jgi:hypothetical protein
MSTQINITPSSKLTVGTTAITSGTVGRVLFEGTGNVLQEDSNLFWDNTNKRLGIGATPDTSTVLDVRAQGALATDLAFRVRNSANNANLYQAQGDGQHLFNPFQTSESVNDVIIGGSNLASSKGGLRIATGNGALTLIGRSNTQNPSIISGNGNFAFETVANGTFAYAQFNVSVAQASNVYITTLASNTNQNSGIRLSAGGNKGLFLGVVGTDFLNINTVSGSVNIGYGSTLNNNARLDVKSQGALSTDVAFRVRNSANTANIISVQGDETITLGATTNANTKLSISGSPIGVSSNATLVAFSATINPATSINSGAFGGFVRVSGGAPSGNYYGLSADIDSGNVNTILNAVFGTAHGNGTNYGGYFRAYGGTSNHALYVQDGDMRFGATTTNKIGFWNKTPILQPTTAVAAGTFVVGVGTAVTDASTFDGYTLGQIARALRNMGILA